MFTWIQGQGSPFPTTATASELGSAFLALCGQAGSQRGGLEALRLVKVNGYGAPRWLSCLSVGLLISAQVMI